jgi:hypothetical protein
MKRNLIPIDNHPDLARDGKTGLIVNINKEKHNRRQLMKQKEAEQREEIDEIKNDVRDIKLMLQKLLENGTNG